MSREEMLAILDKIDSTRTYSYFRSKSNGVEVWIVTDFLKDKRSFMSKEKAQSITKELNAKLFLKQEAKTAYAKSSM